MQIVLIAVFSCVFCKVSAETQNTLSTEASDTQHKTNWEEITASHQAFINASKDKRDKFTCVLNLLKNALAEELENSNCFTEGVAQENVLSSIRNIIQVEQTLEKDTETQIEKPIFTNENKSNAKNTINQNDMTKNTVSNPQNTSNNMEIPSMIPIFRPRQQIMARKESNQNLADFSSTPIVSTGFAKKPIAKSRAVAFVPEKIQVQTNLNPIPSSVMFNIPCQRAVDVLDMSVAIPEEAVCRNFKVNPKVNPIANALETKIPAPVSVNCVEKDDTIAMLFKPQNISLQEVYGNLLKKITITVLVPYHMSKLGEKQK